MVITEFKFSTKFDKTCFFYRTFLLANTTINVILEIFILTFSNANILFEDWEFTLKFYTMIKTLPIIQ